VHTLQSRAHYVVACTALLIGTLLVSVFWGVPTLARRVADTLPVEATEALGRGSLKTLDKLILKPSELPQERQKQLEGAFVAMAEKYPELPLKLHFRSGLPANAFALPDGSIILTDALVESASRDQQIFAVVAHEIGHVKNRDGLRTVLSSTALALVFAAYFADLAQLTTLGAGLPTAFSEARFSQAQEAEADAFALRCLQDAGIRPYHMADMLRTLQARTGGEPGTAAQYLASHPPTSERVALFESDSEKELPVRKAARLIKAKSPTEFTVERSLFDLIEHEDWNIAIIEDKEPHRGITLFQLGMFTSLQREWTRHRRRRTLTIFRDMFAGVMPCRRKACSACSASDCSTRLRTSTEG
jgi:Zn-dependent protease with chaperone function